MNTKKFIENTRKLYEHTTDGNWYVRVGHGLGMVNAAVLTDKETAMSGNHIASCGEYGEANAKFISYMHNNMYELFSLIEQCDLINQWHQRGIMGEPNKALFPNNMTIPEGWIVDDRIPEIDGFLAIRKVEK